MKKLGSIFLLILFSVFYIFMILGIDILFKKMPEIEYTILFMLFHFCVLAGLFCLGVGYFKRNSSAWMDE